MEQFANAAQTTLNGTITSGASSLVVQSASLFPASGTFRLLIDSELIIVGAVSGTTFSSLTRGAENTTAASHNSGATVTAILTAGALAQMRLDIVTFVALVGASYSLPAAVGSMTQIIVKNLSGSSASVSPNGSDTIDGSNSAVSLIANESFTFLDYGAGTWAIC